MGNLTVLIGPNGFGKTYALEKIFKKKLIDDGVKESEIFYMPAEIYLEDEVKDTDTSTSRSKTMEFLLTDLFDLTKIDALRKSLHDEYNNEIDKNKSIINEAFDKSAAKNESQRRTDFIDRNEKFAVTKAITINAKDFKDLIGSGQKYFFFLQLIEKSQKKYIFLDEPEQYSHPSLQNDIAKIITNLMNADKEVYIATHSPKLLSMLDLDLSQIVIINDATHGHKKIELDKVLTELNTKLATVISSLCVIEQAMYDISKAEEVIKTYYYRELLEALFAKKVIIVEGYSDELFVKKVLRESGYFYSDYYIFRANGKFKMPIFAEIFTKLGQDILLYIDKDDPIKDNKHKVMNNYFLNKFSSKCYFFDKNLEDELNTGSKGKKVMSTEMIDFLNTWSYDSKFNIWK